MQKKWLHAKIICLQPCFGISLFVKREAKTQNTLHEIRLPFKVMGIFKIMKKL